MSIGYSGGSRPPHALPESQSFTYVTSSSGKTIAFNLTREGLASLTVDAVEVAAGGLRCQPADVLVGTPGIVNPNWAAADKRLYVLSATRAKIAHVLNGLSIEWLYDFAGEDLTITLSVENETGVHWIGARVYGLTFSFADATWDGIGGPTQGLNTLAQKGRGFHPSFDSRVGGCYATDGVYGVGFTPLDEPAFTRTALCWEYGVKAATAAHTYNVLRAIPHGGKVRFRFQMRVSGNTTWEHLLTPYRTYFHATYGSEPVYTANPAPLGQYVAVPGEAVYDVANPYGYQWYRFDVAEGVKGVDAFLAETLPLLATAGAQGLVIWQPGGSHFGGPTYTPDFDVMPPEVAVNLPTIAAAFSGAGLALGSHSRPSQPVVRKAWQADNTAFEEALFQVYEPTTPYVDDTVPLPSTTMGDRFARMIAAGFALFYLDSFGGSLSDHWLLKRLRTRLGSGVLLAGEYWSDVDLIQMAGYGQVNYADRAYSLYWPTSDKTWDIARWMVPGVQVVATPSTRDEMAPLAIWQWMKDRGITPMFGVGSAGSAADAAEIGALWA